MDVRSGTLAGTWSLPDGWYVVSECCFVPKLGSVGGDQVDATVGGAQDDATDAADGDRGYLLVFATCTEAERAVMGTERAEAGDGRRSRLYVLDAQKLEGEWRGDESDVIVAVIALPGAVPYGLHGCWVPYEELQPHAFVSD